MPPAAAPSLPVDALVSREASLPAAAVFLPELCAISDEPDEAEGAAAGVTDSVADDLAVDDSTAVGDDVQLVIPASSTSNKPLRLIAEC